MTTLLAAPSAQVAGVTQRHRRIPWSAATSAAILLILAVIDVILQPALLNLTQIGLLLQTALPLILIATAQTLVVLVRGIDLSVGGIFVVGNALTVTWVGAGGGAHQLLILATIGVTILFGAINGILVTSLRMEPFIATLGTWTIFDGIALKILPTDGGTPPPLLQTLILKSFFGLPSSVLLVALLILGWSLLKTSTFGHRIYAVGADEERARLNGTPVRRIKLAVYVLAGLCAGLAGIYAAGATTTGTPTAGDGYILTSVAAVVIGGTSLLGGRGGVGLTLMAALSLTFIADIVTSVNLGVWVSVAASSGLLLLVVSIQSLIARAAERTRG